jgi:[acyl-carrier-protein] S-malonyltransferase
MKIAFLYAGQGSQYKGMGKDLYERYPAFREAFDAAELPFDLHTVCFEDPDGTLSQTEYTQPCMVAFACGVTAVLKENGICPDMAAGLSLGEYSALEAAGVFDAKTAIELVAFRGKAMADASRGIDAGMQAVLGLDADILQGCCEEASSEGIVSISNYNCPGQLVIGGESKAVEKAAALAKERGAKRCIPLKVSGPFHTSLMAPAGDALAGYFPVVNFQPMQFPVLFNTLGREKSEEDSIPELLVKQVQTSIHVDATIRRMFEEGVDTFVEIGPGTALSGFVKKTAKAEKISDYTMHSIQNAEELDAVIKALRSGREQA